MISDASPMIFFAKLNRIDMLHKITIPTTVRDEVLRKDTEAIALRRAIEKKQIVIQDPKKLLELDLGKGETAAISLAHERSEGLIADDARAISIAKALGIPVQRTTSIIFRAVKKGAITKKEALQLINQLVQHGYYITPAIYAEVVQRLK